MSYTHEDKVKKKELEELNAAAKDAKKLIEDNRKNDNAAILDALKRLLENYPQIRFEQMLVCLLGELDFYREPSKTLENINLVIKTYGWKK